MTLIKRLLEELEEHPELAKKLAEKLAAYTISVQMDRLVKQMGRMAEEQTKIWQEIRALKEEQTKIWQEIRALKEEQTKIWQEIRALKEEQTKMREDFNKILAEIKEIKMTQDKLKEGLSKLSESMMYGFSQLSKFAGVTFEQFVRILLTNLFRRFGEIPEDAELKRATIDGEEVDIFLEDPLIVGEVTAHAESDEIEKLLRKAKRAEEIYGRRARLILIAETSRSDVARELRRRAEEEGVELVIGKET
ncbi:MAG: hypothetical protein QW418_05450 [Candidatus Korarchaeum sp.]